MISREAVGKEYPPFSVTLTEDLSREIHALLRGSDPHESYSWPPPLIWPAVLTLHGTAGLIALWEDLGVSPLHPRLISEGFRYGPVPAPGAELLGRLRVEDVGERFEPGRGVEDQVDILVEFTNSEGVSVASYRSSYRIPVAVMPQG